MTEVQIQRADLSATVNTFDANELHPPFVTLKLFDFERAIGVYIYLPDVAAVLELADRIRDAALATVPPVVIEEGKQ